MNNINIDYLFGIAVGRATEKFKNRYVTPSECEKFRSEIKTLFISQLNSVFCTIITANENSTYMPTLIQQHLSTYEIDVLWKRALTRHRKKNQISY